MISSFKLTKHLPTPGLNVIVYGRQAGEEVEAGVWLAAWPVGWGWDGWRPGSWEASGWRWRARCSWLQALTGHLGSGQLKFGAEAPQRKHLDVESIFSSIFCTPLEFCLLQPACCSQTLLTLLSFTAWCCISLFSLPIFFPQTRHNPRRGNPINVIFQESPERRSMMIQGGVSSVTLGAIDLQVSSGPWECKHI